MEHVLIAQQVTKVYRMGEVDVPALRGIDLALDQGELAVLLGASGSGKSTLLNILGGLDVPTAGRVSDRDRELQRVEVAADAVAEVVARVHGRGRDAIRVEDEMVLVGRASRGPIKTRIALAEDARAEVVGVTRGQAPGARGHMDCLEIVR